MLETICELVNLASPTNRSCSLFVGSMMRGHGVTGAASSHSRERAGLDLLWVESTIRWCVDTVQNGMCRVNALMGQIRFLGLLVLLATTVISPAEANDQQRAVDRARLVVQDFLDDPNFKGMRVYVQNAYAVLVVPDMLQAGFIIGAEHGLGVLLVRDRDSGVWSDPAFYDVYGGSLGLQIGGQSSDVIFTIMNPEAIDKLLSSRFKLGADASMSVGRIGAGVGAGTTIQFGEDVYVFSRNQGLYGGLALDGSVVIPREDWNSAYYGRPLTPIDIISADTPRNNGSRELRDALNLF